MQRRQEDNAPQAKNSFDPSKSIDRRRAEPGREGRS
jgi:hypothetical protein